MIAALRSFWKLFDPIRLTGPLFDKELRVSSRRKRNYLLRFIYVAALTVFVALVWGAVSVSRAPGALASAQMAEAGKTIISTIVVFQFAAIQLIAIVMLSTSISDEVYNRTLGLLMTTPINGLQIVIGKVASKLLQLILLLAISLPLLAIIRVFGGVAWGYVLSGLCITLTSAIFVGTLSLFFSIHNKRAYVVIIKTICTVFCLFFLLPQLIATLRMAPITYTRGTYQGVAYPVFWGILAHFSPFDAMSRNTMQLMSPVAAPGVARFYWPAHCAFMLGLSALLMIISGAVVRRVALRQAVGQLDPVSRRKRRRKAGGAAGAARRSDAAVGVIRRVSDSPVLWKDMRAPLIRGAEGRNSIIGLAVTIASILVTYSAWAANGLLDADFTHTTYVLMFVFIAAMFHIVLSASSITTEKESRAWPILLATSMDDWRIFTGKAIAVFRRCLPIWLLLAGHVLIFVVARYIHPILVVHLLMLFVWLVVFLTCCGLYFSARFKRTTSAVVATFALLLVLWAVVPSIAGLMGQAYRRRDTLTAYCLYANPAVQAGAVAGGASGRYKAHRSIDTLRYEWLDGKMDCASTTKVMAVNMLAYVAIGLLFAWRAKCRFRRNVF